MTKSAEHEQHVLFITISKKKKNESNSDSNMDIILPKENNEFCVDCEDSIDNYVK